MYIKESLSHADDSEEEGEEDHVEGGREAEGREEDEEEVSTLEPRPVRAVAVTAASKARPLRPFRQALNSSARGMGPSGP